MLVLQPRSPMPSPRMPKGSQSNVRVDIPPFAGAHVGTDPDILPPAGRSRAGSDGVCVSFGERTWPVRGTCLSSMRQWCRGRSQGPGIHRTARKRTPISWAMCHPASGSKVPYCVRCFTRRYDSGAQSLPDKSLDRLADRSSSFSSSRMAIPWHGTAPTSVAHRYSCEEP